MREEVMRKRREKEKKGGKERKRKESEGGREEGRKG